MPTGIKFFNWIGTMWHGQLTFTTPMLFSIGFLFAFLMGGVTGIMLASPPIDFATHDTYFVVAHFHQVLFGTAVFAGFAGVYYWYPKMFGRMLRREPGQVALLADVHRLLGDVHAPVRRRPAAACPAAWPATRPTWAGRATTSSRRSAPSSSAISFAFLLVNFCVSWRKPDPGRGQPVGRAHARVVHHLAAAAPQLHPPPADPLGAPDVGLQPP